ncbi:MAG: hypothetical protein HKN99_12220 [Winogradskyella sp.]|nr:hypothetical protein [Winogradskyella sp.]MBT8375393.1 hypothetical protein [Bacteroidia bacterium]NNC46640.1 hypothetical protein [Winogradskyella sp.]NNF85681.1 hypothetical protein [Winogradskyella sp.]NNK40681.1 hypothetical protein [Winogradskyella sp.]
MYYVSRLLVFLWVMVLVLSCKSNETKAIDCIDQVIKLDDSLGKKRNFDCVELSLSKTIINYTDVINSIDFSTCPDEFTTAFKSHIEAWKNMIEVTDNHDTLRGEMHDLFDSIEHTKDSLQFKIYLNAIWSTWADVEKAMEFNR